MPAVWNKLVESLYRDGLNPLSMVEFQLPQNVENSDLNTTIIL